MERCVYIERDKYNHCRVCVGRAEYADPSSDRWSRYGTSDNAAEAIDLGNCPINDNEVFALLRRLDLLHIGEQGCWALAWHGLDEPWAFPEEITDEWRALHRIHWKWSTRNVLVAMPIAWGRHIEKIKRAIDGELRRRQLVLLEAELHNVRLIWRGLAKLKRTQKGEHHGQQEDRDHRRPAAVHR